MHPDTELIAYLRDELPPDARERIGAHVAACAECRGTLDDFRDILAQLQQTRPEPPPVAWGRFQAELRARIEQRSPRRSGWVLPWRAWAGVSLAAAVGLAALALTLDRRAPGPEFTPMEEVALGDQLDLLQEYRVVERLDLLEDLDVIRNLDRLEPRSEGPGLQHT
jgi:hypothetical protein